MRREQEDAQKSQHGDAQATISRHDDAFVKQPAFTFFSRGDHRTVICCGVFACGCRLARSSIMSNEARRRLPQSPTMVAIPDPSRVGRLRQARVVEQVYVGALKVRRHVVAVHRSKPCVTLRRPARGIDVQRQSGTTTPQKGNATMSERGVHSLRCDGAARVLPPIRQAVSAGSRRVFTSRWRSRHGRDTRGPYPDLRIRPDERKGPVSPI